MKTEQSRFGRRIPRNISITASDNQGFMVQVGCANLIYSDIDDLVRDLREYVEDPKEMEKTYTNQTEVPEEAPEPVRNLGGRVIARREPLAGAGVDGSTVPTFDGGDERMPR